MATQANDIFHENTLWKVHVQLPSFGAPRPRHPLRS